MFDPAFNAAFQSWSSPGLDLFFQAVTNLGYSLFLLPALGALCWGWDKRHAFMVIQLVGYCIFVNHLIKESVQALRPFQAAPDLVRLLDTHMRAAIVEGRWVWKYPFKTSYSFPSGHAQAAICFWGALAFHIRRPAFVAPAVLMIVLIPLSRVYLGCHFLGDATTGLMVGGALLGLYVLIVRCLELDSRYPSNDMLGALAFLGPLLFFFLVPDRSTALIAGLLIGFSAGYFAERRTVRFSNDGSPGRRALRVVLGVAFMFGVAGLVLWLPKEVLARPYSFPLIERAAAFCLMGLAASWLVPFLLVRTGLAGQSEPVRLA